MKLGGNKALPILAERAGKGNDLRIEAQHAAKGKWALGRFESNNCSLVYLRSGHVGFMEREQEKDMGPPTLIFRVFRQ